jgi:membrane-associated phospholipid phosphatase
MAFLFLLVLIGLHGFLCMQIGMHGFSQVFFWQLLSYSATCTVWLVHQAWITGGKADDEGFRSGDL